MAGTKRPAKRRAPTEADGRVNIGPDEMTPEARKRAERIAQDLGITLIDPKKKKKGK